MGFIRKTMSLGTLGAVDLRSDKERAARNARLTKQAVNRGNRQQKRLLQEQNRILSRQQRPLAHPDFRAMGYEYLDEVPDEVLKQAVREERREMVEGVKNFFRRK